VFPAQTWPHKNHVNLLRALAHLRDEGLEVPVVFTGRRNEAAHQIDSVIRQLDLAPLVTWLGFLESDDLLTVLRRATALVMPSLFEAASGPLWEAFAAGIPAACSAVTSLPDQAGDAALLFDPLDPRDIARAIERLWRDESLRSVLSKRGRRRVEQFSWDRTARTFRAHYRQIAGRQLTDDDRHSLDSAPGI
jgi:glycosyltransferase involved in cell wall biosynthesis